MAKRWTTLTHYVVCQEKDGAPIVLGPGQPVKKITGHAEGGFSFQALTKGVWFHLRTFANLPKMIDRRPRQGRPAKSGVPRKLRVTFGFTREEYNWVKQASGDKTIPDFMRDFLHSAGMPKPTI